MASKADLNLFVADRLEQLRKDLLDFNLTMDNLTFIARDSKNDDMIVCVTNESAEGLEKACQLAIKNEPDPQEEAESEKRERWFRENFMTG